jgi:aminomethyltransferase
MEGRFVPRAEDVVRSSAGEGRVTSGTFSPIMGKGVAMAYLPPEVTPGESVEVLIHDKPRPGIARKLPVYSKKNSG